MINTTDCDTGVLIKNISLDFFSYLIFSEVLERVPEAYSLNL